MRCPYNPSDSRITLQAVPLTQQFLVMAALCNRAGHYIFALWFLLSKLIYLSSIFFPRLILTVADVYHTSTHGVALVS